MGNPVLKKKISGETRSNHVGKAASMGALGGTAVMPGLGSAEGALIGTAVGEWTSIWDKNPDGCVCLKAPRPNTPCETIKEFKDDSRYQKTAPYPDDFFNKPTTGEKSSSYFIKIGECPTMLNETECKNKGYDWIENPLYKKTPEFLRQTDFLKGSCLKPRYAYISNSPGFFDPTTSKELSDLITAGSSGAGAITGAVAGSGLGPEGTIAGTAVGGLVGDAIGKKIDIGGLKGAIPSIMSDMLSTNPLQLLQIMFGVGK